MSATAITIIFSAMVGASVIGGFIGFLGGRRYQREALASSDSLVESLEGLVKKQREALDAQASRDESEDKLRDTLMEAQESNSATIAKLIAQRDQLASEAGYDVSA